MSTSRRPATLQDVAKLAGVSVRTVSNVVNNYPYVRTETRETVERAVAELNYRTNPIARNLRRGRTGMLGLAIPELAQPYYAELADTVLAEARVRGFSVILESAVGKGAADAKALMGDLRMMTDGLILSPGHLDPDGTHLDELGVPVVVLTERSFDTGVDHVAMQDTAAAHAATHHLIESGRRRIAAIGVRPSEKEGTAALREAGYRAALTEAGIPVDSQLLAASDEWQPGSGYRALLEMLDRVGPRTPRPDAVFAFNDSLALGAMHALAARGLDVPGDVAVVGFDDITAARFSNPPLTTIATGRGEAARLALELLVARIDGTRTGPGEEVLTNFSLIVRGSSRAAKSLLPPAT